MNKLKQLYRDYFGLTEATDAKQKVSFDSTKLALYNQELEKTAEIMKKMTESA